MQNRLGSPSTNVYDVLIDVNRDKAEGEVDLNHAMPFSRPMRIWAGDYTDIAGAAVTVIAAGAAQKPGESRLELLKKNAAVFRQVVPQVAQHNPGGLLLVATNPVDVLSYAAWKLSCSPRGASLARAPSWTPRAYATS